MKVYLVIYKRSDVMSPEMINKTLIYTTTSENDVISSIIEILTNPCARLDQVLMVLTSMGVVQELILQIDNGRFVLVNQDDLTFNK